MIFSMSLLQDPPHKGLGAKLVEEEQLLYLCSCNHLKHKWEKRGTGVVWPMSSCLFSFKFYGNRCLAATYSHTQTPWTPPISFFIFAHHCLQHLQKHRWKSYSQLVCYHRTSLVHGSHRQSTTLQSRSMPHTYISTLYKHLSSPWVTSCVW